MTIQQAIQKAIEGGYRKEAMLMLTHGHNLSSIWIDPLFWQSLGKSMGWVNIHGGATTTCRNCGKESGANSIGSCDYCGCYARKNFPYTWLYHWHRFIDHLAEGKDIESYFETL